jgi:dimethylargininase
VIINSYRFTQAITRKPSASVINGLRAVDTGTPDFDLMCQHHSDYIACLKSAGATVTELDATEAFPDACFVEDTTLCLGDIAILMRPGADTRIGEVAEMRPTLEEKFEQVLELTSPGNIEGGDILTTSKEILVGRSARTNAEGIAALTELAAKFGYPVREVFTPADVLHFKTDCSLLDEETILTTPRLDATGCFAGYKVIQTCEGEEACANSIRYNDIVIMPDGFPKTYQKLVSAGYEVRQIGNSECAKIDGGMSCLSLRF